MMGPPPPLITMPRNVLQENHRVGIRSARHTEYRASRWPLPLFGTTDKSASHSNKFGIHILYIDRTIIQANRLSEPSCTAHAGSKTPLERCIDSFGTDRIVCQYHR